MYYYMSLCLIQVFTTFLLKFDARISFKFCVDVSLVDHYQFVKFRVLLLFKMELSVLLCNFCQFPRSQQSPCVDHRCCCRRRCHCCELFPLLTPLKPPHGFASNFALTFPRSIPK